MIDATSVHGYARLIVLIETGSDCLRVMSSDIVRRLYTEAESALAHSNGGEK